VYWREPLLRARSRGSLCARRISRWPPALLRYFVHPGRRMRLWAII